MGNLGRLGATRPPVRFLRGKRDAALQLAGPGIGERTIVTFVGVD